MHMRYLLQPSQIEHYYVINHQAIIITTTTTTTTRLKVLFTLSLLHLFEHFDPLQYLSLTRFFQLPRQHEFIQNTVNLVEIKDNIQFTHVAKVRVEEFDKQMNRFQVGQFIVRHVHGNGKKEASVSPINEFVGIVFNKVGVFLVAGRDEAVTFGLDADLFGFGVGSGGAARRLGVGWDVPLGQTCLALTIL